jgi:hypothetical protein
VHWVKVLEGGVWECHIFRGRGRLRCRKLRAIYALAYLTLHCCVGDKVEHLTPRFSTTAPPAAASSATTACIRAAPVPVTWGGATGAGAGPGNRRSCAAGPPQGIHFLSPHSIIRQPATSMLQIRAAGPTVHAMGPACAVAVKDIIHPALPLNDHVHR